LSGTVRLLGSPDEDGAADVIREGRDVLRELPPLLAVDARLEVERAPLGSLRLRELVEVGEGADGAVTHGGADGTAEK
jgi:hypothetical protein